MDLESNVCQRAYNVPSVSGSRLTGSQMYAAIPNCHSRKEFQIINFLHIWIFKKFRVTFHLKVLCFISKV